MTPEYKWLATQIVRCAERWPDRIGPKGACNQERTQWCLLATISHAEPRKYRTVVSDREAIYLASLAHPLNDAGHRWGDIPKLLGLVPGELKEEVTCEKDSRVGDSAESAAADVVCRDTAAELDHAGVG